MAHWRHLGPPPHTGHSVWALEGFRREAAGGGLQSPLTRHHCDLEDAGREYVGTKVYALCSSLSTLSPSTQLTTIAGAVLCQTTLGIQLDRNASTKFRGGAGCHLFFFFFLVVCTHSPESKDHLHNPASSVQVEAYTPPCCKRCRI